MSRVRRSPFSISRTSPRSEVLCISEGVGDTTGWAVRWEGAILPERYLTRRTAEAKLTAMHKALRECPE